MDVKLDYGRHGLNVDLPERTHVIRPLHTPRVADEVIAIQNAIRNPIGTESLTNIVNPRDKICIVHTDITRATPNDRLLPVIIAELETAGIPSHNITLLNGLGTHRFQTDGELRQMLGDSIVDNYICMQHDSKDPDQLISLGQTSNGNPVRINKAYMDADVRILTGFIEPHLFAGFSGGPKAVLPALSGFESVGTNHSTANISHPKATWGVMSGNPIWEEMKEVALKTNPSFLVNVSLNEAQHITGVFAGEMLAAHAAGCAFVKDSAMVPVSQLYDIVITTNSGYPLDQSLYQSGKGMSAASKIVKEGGAIICVSACEDGIPDYGGYLDLLQRGGSPDGVLDLVNQPGFMEHDQWQVQIQAMVQKRAEVYVYSDGLTDQQIQQALLNPCRDIPETVERLVRNFGPDATIAALPQGPQTIPFLESR
jgi:nickel-dependent lactate racemase